MRPFRSQQFLHLGEAWLAASVYFVSGARNIAPADERDNWSAGQALDVFETRLGLARQRQTPRRCATGRGVIVRGRLASQGCRRSR
jgi:hypothetical protein